MIGGSGSASISDVSELNAAGITVGVQSGTTSDIFANGDADNMASLPDATVVAYEDFPSVISRSEQRRRHVRNGRRTRSVPRRH